MDRRFIHKKNVSDTLDVLKKLIEKFNEHQIAYYLDFGTLLGAVRDSKFIEWDDDVDISLLHEEEYPKIKNILLELKREYGYRVSFKTFKESISKEMKKNKTFDKTIEYTNLNNYHISTIRNNRFWMFARGNVTIDIFFKYQHNHKLHWFAMGKSNQISTVFLQKGFKQIKFYDITCSIPIDSENYLTELYGDWKTPNKKWTEKDSLTQIKG